MAAAAWPAKSVMLEWLGCVQAASFKGGRWDASCIEFVVEGRLLFSSSFPFCIPYVYPSSFCTDGIESVVLELFLDLFFLTALVGLDFVLVALVGLDLLLLLLSFFLLFFFLLDVLLASASSSSGGAAAIPGSFNQEGPQVARLPSALVEEVRASMPMKPRVTCEPRGATRHSRFARRIPPPKKRVHMRRASCHLLNEHLYALNVALLRWVCKTRGASDPRKPHCGFWLKGICNKGRKCKMLQHGLPMKSLVLIAVV